jgi:UDP-glucose 4-epimerase
MNSILITGGAGFVGSHLAEQLVEKGYEVTIVDNLSTGKMSNIPKIKDQRSKIKDQITFVKADIRDIARLNKIKGNFDAVVHLAAQIYVEKSILDPKETYDINLNGTFNILDFAREKRISKFIFASSSAVYGNVNKENISEEELLNQISPYGLTKMLAEQAVASYGRFYGITTTSLRFFNIYGPRQNNSSPYSGVISKFLEQTEGKGKQPEIHGNGEQTRDFIYVEDVVEAIISSLKLGDKKNHIYNVGTGNTISIKDLFNLMVDLKERKDKIKPLYKPKREGDIQFSGANISKIKNELGFIPKYKIKEGLLKLIN